jgi:hypothetical protein
MEVVSALIEWLGVLFLSVEAIKIDNFKNLTERLIRIKSALNPVFSYREKIVYVEVAPKGYEFLRKYSSLITYIIGLVVLMIFLITTKLYSDVFNLTQKHLLQFIDVSYVRRLINVIGLFCLFFLWCHFTLVMNF